MSSSGNYSILAGSVSRRCEQNRKIQQIFQGVRRLHLINDTGLVGTTDLLVRETSLGNNYQIVT